MLDLLILHAEQLLTMTGGSQGPLRGQALDDVGIIPDGGVGIENGCIAFVGPSSKAPQKAKQTIDASGKVVMPGFVDPHTHLVFAGSREAEFDLRIRGESYQEIASKGGGIRSTVRATRAASQEDLVHGGMHHLDRMLRWGTTTAESKSGYGLTLEDEIKILKAIQELDHRHPVDLVPTFLGAHDVPDEWRQNPRGYVDLVIHEMIPAVASEGLARFCDVFCDEGYFDLADSRRILAAGVRAGMRPKLHADELASFGGAELACEVGAVSADHLIKVSSVGITKMAETGVLAVLLPGTSLMLDVDQRAPARQIIDAGAPVALATDFNPGSCAISAMPIVIGLACSLLKMTPAEALNASTINAAWAIGEGAAVGSLEVGKDADILLLNISDYRQVPYWFGRNPVDAVIKAGKRIQLELE